MLVHNVSLALDIFKLGESINRGVSRTCGENTVNLFVLWLFSCEFSRKSFNARSKYTDNLYISRNFGNAADIVPLKRTLTNDITHCSFTDYNFKKLQCY